MQISLFICIELVSFVLENSRILKLAAFQLLSREKHLDL